MRDKEKHAKEKQDAVLSAWKSSREEKRVKVDEEEILQVVAKWTGIPLKRMEQDEAQRLLAMEAEMAKVVIGQQEAVSAICKALRRSRADLKDPRRPIGTFALLGPTGVGKTLLAKSLAETMFGDSKSLIQLDMSEYMERHNASRMVGSPPGYVGYEEGGQLTEQVRRKPYSVVLFDEIEKAHPDVMNMLLQILEEGKLTDNVGRVVNFRNTVILMTLERRRRDHQEELHDGLLADFRREQLRKDARENHGRSQAAVPSRVPQPPRRHYRLPLAHQAGLDPHSSILKSRKSWSV
jgi:ATP-dependent Clp protease ATP-binding subunit ClpC